MDRGADQRGPHRTGAGGALHAAIGDLFGLGAQETPGAETAETAEKWLMA